MKFLFPHLLWRRIPHDLDALHMPDPPHNGAIYGSPKAAIPLFGGDGVATQPTVVLAALHRRTRHRTRLTPLGTTLIRCEIQPEPTHRQIARSPGRRLKWQRPSGRLTHIRPLFPRKRTENSDPGGFLRLNTMSTGLGRSGVMRWVTVHPAALRWLRVLTSCLRE